MKNILLVSQSFYPNSGGVSTLILNLTKQLKAKGFDVFTLHFSSLNDSSEIALDVDFNGNSFPISDKSFPIETLKLFSSFKETLYKWLHCIESSEQEIESVEGYNAYCQVNDFFGHRISEIIEKYSIDLIHVHDYQLMHVTKNQSWEIPKILSLHFPFLKYGENLNRFLIQSTSSYDKISFSTEEYEKGAHVAGIPPSITTVLFPFIDERVVKVKHDEWDKNIISPSILCIQRFDSKSGHNQLIRAFKEILEFHPALRLVLVGGPSFTDKISTVRHNYKIEIEQLVKELELETKVIFKGHVDYFSLGELYSNSTIVCLLSKMECFGLTITEAMSLGKPVIGTNVGGLKLQISDGFNGYLINVDDIKGTIEAFNKILINKKLEVQMGLNSKQRFQDLFLPETIFKKYLQLYLAT